MSRTKKQSPAAIAESIAKYIAKQEETLKRYPVGPMANSARVNLRKGQAALQALQGKNEQMKQQMQGQVQQQQGPVQQFTDGGGTNETTRAENSAIRQALVDDGNVDQLAMFDVFTAPNGAFKYSDDAALAITSITEKESKGDATVVESGDYKKTGEWGVNDSHLRGFTGVGKPYKDYARLRAIHGNAASMKTEDLDKIFTGTKAEQETKFFNTMYGKGDKATQLGNTEPGDGVKFRGRGAFQLTGRGNYQALSDWAYDKGYVDTPNYYVDNPDAVATQDAHPNVTGYYYEDNNFGGGMYGVDLTKPLSDAEIAAVMDNAYAITAGSSQTGNYNYASNRPLYEGSMKKMRDWNNEIRGNASGVDKVDYSYWDDSLPDQMAGDGKFNLDTEGQVILDYLAERHPGLGYDAEDFTPGDLTKDDYKRFQRDLNITGKGVDGAIGSRSRSAYHLNRAKELESAKTQLDKKSYAKGIENELAAAQQGVRPDQDATRVATGEQQKAQVLTDPLGQVPEEPYVHRQTLPEVVIRPKQEKMDPGYRGERQNRFYPGDELASPLQAKDPGLVPNQLPEQRLAAPILSGLPTDNTFPLTPPSRREQRQAKREDRRSDRAAANIPPIPTPMVPPSTPGNMAAALMDPELMASAFSQGLAPTVPMFYDGGYTKEDLNFAGRTWDLDNTKMDELLLDTDGRPAIIRDGRTGRIVHMTKAMYFDANSSGNMQAVVDEALGRTPDLIQTGDINLNDMKYKNVAVTDMYLPEVTAGEFENRAPATPSTPVNPSTPQDRLPNQPVATQTTRRTGFEGARPSPREGMELYDVHGNLQGTYTGAGNIRTADGDGRNIYNRTMREREAFYDKDGNMIGTYQGGGVFGGSDSPNPQIMAGQALERYVQGAGRRQTANSVDPGNASTSNMAGSTTAREEEERQAALANAATDNEQEIAGPTQTPLRNLPAGAPDSYNLDMGNASLINAIPAAASLASVPIMRDAVNRMQGPTAPVTADMPQFNYRSNLGQQLQDARTGVNALSRNTNLSSGQQAANRQGLLAERFRQENRLYNMDSAEYARQKNLYDRTAQQAQIFNAQLRNKYAQDMQAFNNQMNLYDAQIKMQPLNVLSSSAQDYLKNIYGPSQQVALAGLGRNFDTGLLDSET